jgi:hypothetical protein
VERSIKQVKRWNKGEVVEWSAYCGCEKERCCVDLAMPHDKIKNSRSGDAKPCNKRPPPLARLLTQALQEEATETRARAKNIKIRAAGAHHSEL